MHTRPNVYMDEVLLGPGGKTAPKFKLSQQQLYQSATSINDQQHYHQQNMQNMRHRQRKWRVLLSIGLLLPALAAIIGIVAWTISIEVASANESAISSSSQKSANHQNNHNNHHNHHHHNHQNHNHNHPSSHQHQSPQHQPLTGIQQNDQQQQQQQQQPQQQKQQHKRHQQQQQPQEQQPSIALPQQAAQETIKSESQACATLVLTNLKQQLDSNSDNIENRANESNDDVVANNSNDDTSSYETDDRQQQQQDRDQDATVLDTSNQGTGTSKQQQDDDSSYEAIASAISTTLNAGGSPSSASASSSSSSSSSSGEPSSASALKLPAEPIKRTAGENVADVIDHLVMRRRQAADKSRPSGAMRASQIVVVAPISDSMKARSLTKQVSEPQAERRSDKQATEESSAGSAFPNEDEAEQEQEQEQDQMHESATSSDSQEAEVKPPNDMEQKAASDADAGAAAPAIVNEVEQEPAVDRSDWVPAWPLRRNAMQSIVHEEPSIHVSSQPKEARARSRRQEINPSLMFERIASLTKRQHQQKASSPQVANQMPQQQQPKLYSTEQIIKDHVMKTRSRTNSSLAAGGEINEKQEQERPVAMMAPQQQHQQQQQQQQQQQGPQEQPQPQQPHDPSRQQQQLPNRLWQQQLARLAGSQHHPSFITPEQLQLHDMIGSSSQQRQQQQQVPQFFFQPNQQHLLNQIPNAIHLSNPHVQPAHHLQQQQQQQHQYQPKTHVHTTEHHFLLSPSQFQNFMNSPLFQQQALGRQQVASISNRNSVAIEPVAATPVGGIPDNRAPQGGAMDHQVNPSASGGAMRAMRSLVSPTSQAVQQQQQQQPVDQEAQGSDPMMRSMQYLTSGPGGAAAADGLVISEQQQQEAAALATSGSEPRAHMIQQHQHQQPLDQEVQESYGQMPAYQMAEGGYGGNQYHHGGGGYGGDHDKKAKGITFHFGGGPIGGGTQLITSPMGIFKHLMIPLLPNPRVNLNGKVVFGVVLEKSTAFGSPPKKKKYKFWGR